VADGQDIPYQLRPNKFIDRQIFLDLLIHICAIKGPSSYLYVSMGGKHLVDHESVYRRVGIRNLFSFDGSDWVVQRQLKNAPHDDVICQQMHSSSLPGEIEGLLEAYAPAQNFVAWLDYTTAKDRLAQFQEFSQLLQKCQPGDVARISLNADYRTLGNTWKEDGYESPAVFRAGRLKAQLGAYFPSGIAKIAKTEMSIALAQGLALVVAEAAKVTGLNYRPVLLTTYADGLRMFTATILTLDAAGGLPSGIAEWEFLADGWERIIDISAPDLSMREKMLVDRCLTREPKAILDEIGFTLADDPDEAENAIRSYKKLHRFYPTFYAIGIQ
jgi:hypothetical protein